MEELKKDLIEIRKNIFISKNDPDFLKKYIKYNPTDSEMLFQYAKELESKGDTVKAYQFFSKAARYGHYHASKIIEKTAKAVVATPIVKTYKKKDGSNFNKMLLGILFALLLFSLGFVLIFLISSLLTMNKINATNVYEKNITNATLMNASPTKPEELVFHSVHSAIEYYQDINGVYPESLLKLTGDVPYNYLSFIPDAVHYERTGSGFSLSVDGLVGSATTTNGLLSLVFYEKTNELGVLKGDELLALYPVASGIEDLPPVESIVTRRIVAPNGGQGALGTRGLQLTDQFAIHGTNEPSLIGKDVTMGCLRMKNEDIEKLFPYIPLGTPFFVESEFQPGKPSFLNGFPSFPTLPEQYDYSDETTPNITYKWKL